MFKPYQASRFVFFSQLHLPTRKEQLPTAQRFERKNLRLYSLSSCLIIKSFLPRLMIFESNHRLGHCKSNARLLCWQIQTCRIAQNTCWGCSTLQRCWVHTSHHPHPAGGLTVAARKIFLLACHGLVPRKQAEPIAQSHRRFPDKCSPTKMQLWITNFYPNRKPEVTAGYPSW